MLATLDRARGFVDRMWEPSGQYFFTGSNDGSTINPTPLSLDPQAWGWLALRDRRFAGALDWAARELATTDTPDAPNSQLPAGVSLSGVTFSSASLTSTAPYNGIPVDPRGVWLEGTAQVVTAFRDRRGRDWRRTSDALETAIHTAVDQLGAGQRIGGAEITPRGVVAASSLIDSGFGFGYFQIQHVGATAWSIMAAAYANPMRLGGLVLGKLFKLEGDSFPSRQINFPVTNPSLVRARLVKQPDRRIDDALSARRPSGAPSAPAPRSRPDWDSAIPRSSNWGRPCGRP